MLDPFMGSGTTGRVCDKLNRIFVGYDLQNFIGNV
ncbi:site-specific DNA-methyltransferase [Flavobacteriaceae bacterium]|nr:site-specific DNA-methyltransferase [Flavobacteriaceae bacterium]